MALQNRLCETISVFSALCGARNAHLLRVNSVFRAPCALELIRLLDLSKPSSRHYIMGRILWIVFFF